MAIIEVLPESSGGINGVVNATTTMPGDVIVVECGVYHESITVPASKSNIRIVAKHKHCAILDGDNTLSTAFTLDGTTGVEINGFVIRNYTDYGINLTGPGGNNRIVENQIKDIMNGPGIATAGTGQPVLNSGNLFWKNYVKRTGSDGIYLDSDSNWVIENSLYRNQRFGVVLSRSNNALVNNQISNNANEGIIDLGFNNLILYNHISNNGVAGDDALTDTVIIGNSVKRNIGIGIKSSTNDFIANNEVRCNGQSGVLVLGSFVIIQENEIENNHNNGIYVLPDSNSTFIFRNDVDDNTPHQIKDLGTNTVKLQNKIED